MQRNPGHTGDPHQDRTSWLLVLRELRQRYLLYNISWRKAQLSGATTQPISAGPKRPAAVDDDDDDDDATVAAAAATTAAGAALQHDHASCDSKVCEKARASRE